MTIVYFLVSGSPGEFPTYGHHLGYLSAKATITDGIASARHSSVWIVPGTLRLEDFQ